MCLIHTPHGIVETPGFVAVGTNAALKFVDHAIPDAAGHTNLMFMNTLHLSLHPGSEVVQAAGGLHKFMNRNKPIITDSGGFQIFSMMHQSPVFDLELGIKRRSGRKYSADNAAPRGGGEDGEGQAGVASDVSFSPFLVCSSTHYFMKQQRSKMHMQ